VPEQLLPDVLDGTIQPGKVFDRTVSLAEGAHPPLSAMRRGSTRDELTNGAAPGARRWVSPSIREEEQRL
jgi:hypothetical protein